MPGERLRNRGCRRGRGIVERCCQRVELDQPGRLLLLRQRRQLVQADVRAELQFVPAVDFCGVVVQDKKVKKSGAVIYRLKVVA